MIFPYVACLVSTLRTGASSVSLNLIPTPVNCQLGQGSFAINDRAAVVFDPKIPEDRFAANQLTDEIFQDVGVRLGEFTAGVSRLIVLERTLSQDTGFQASQGYHLDVSTDEIKISASTADGIFNGVQTLKQLVRANRSGEEIPNCHIDDWPALQYRGWQHDISRGPIPTLKFLKQAVRTLSEYKLNMMTLYTEHVFKLKKHPDIAPSDGITADEIRDLSRYAHQYHVELVGNFQSFGHFANILKLPAYKDLAETPSVISPAKEASYQFLSDVYSEVAPAYTSPLFDINCDEVSGLGQGPSRDMVKELGVGGVYAKHINRICDLLKPYGKTPMMWGDIALHYPSIVPLLPKDLIVLPWSYGPSASFQSQIEPFTKFGLRFMVCPGVSCWSEIWPNTQNATVNISNFIRDGAQDGAIGVLNTSWDDDGQNLFNDNWYEFTWGAECSWRPVKEDANQDENEVRQARERDFNSKFPSVFYGLKGSELSAALNSLSANRRNPVAAGLNNRVFWRDPVSTASRFADKSVVQTYLDGLNPIEAELKAARRHATHNGPTLDYALFAAKQERYLGESLLAVDSSMANGGDTQKLARTVRDLKKEYVSLWNRENRKWWLDKNLARYDELERRITGMANGDTIHGAR